VNLIIDALDKGIERSGIDRRKISLPSDIPFSPETIKKLGVDYFQTARGRAIAFGTGLKLGNPALRVVPFVGDLMTLGGNHFVHGGRRNMELLVICVNNFIYKKIAGKPVPSSQAKFSPYSTFEEPFNFPHLGNSCGAVYTARWTALHTEELVTSIAEAIVKPGLAVIEVIAPGPSYYTNINDIDENILKFYYDNSTVKNNANPREVEITPEDKIIVGKFTDKTRPTFIDSYNTQLGKILGDKFIPHGLISSEKKETGGCSDGGN
jgi:2-oxoglutarate ferredoxin oxidoreductase subunit beta